MKIAIEETKITMHIALFNDGALITISPYKSIEPEEEEGEQIFRMVVEAMMIGLKYIARGKGATMWIRRDESWK